MSGSSDAATMAEKTRLEAELRSAKNSLNNLYYDHALTSRSDALDDEMESFEKSKMDYLENLRESIKNTDLVIEETYQHVMANADIVLSTLEEYSTEYNFTVTPNLLNPWEVAAETATNFKNTAYTDVNYLINEDGIITQFGVNATEIFTNTFGSASESAKTFRQAVDDIINLPGTGIKALIENSKGNIKDNIQEPWKQSREEGPIFTFSEYVKDVLDGAIATAKEKRAKMYNELIDPWCDAQNVVHTFFADVEDLLNKLVLQAEEKGKAIKESLKSAIPDVNAYKGNAGSGNGNDTNDKNLTSNINPKPSETMIEGDNVKSLQRFLNYIFSAGLDVDGKYGQKTKQAVSNAQSKARSILNGNWIAINGKYDNDTRNVFLACIDALAKDRSDAGTFKQVYKSYLPPAFYAKGTLGTKKDEWAMDSEPQYGDELVLVPTAQGNLSYMRKGTGVVPATLTKEIMNIANVGLDGLMSANKFGANVNIINNAVNKPELYLSFDSLVHVDNCSQDTLKDLEKMVDSKIDKFSKNLNYSLKRFI